jgi:hypothetical protein
MQSRKRTEQVVDTMQILWEYLAAKNLHIMYIGRISQRVERNKEGPEKAEKTEKQKRIVWAVAEVARVGYKRSMKDFPSE